MAVPSLTIGVIAYLDEGPDFEGLHLNRHLVVLGVIAMAATPLVSAKARRLLLLFAIHLLRSRSERMAFRLR